MRTDVPAILELRFLVTPQNCDAPRTNNITAIKILQGLSFRFLVRPAPTFRLDAVGDIDVWAMTLHAGSVRTQGKNAEQFSTECRFRRLWFDI